MIDMANAAGIEPVMTTYAVGIAPEDMADLVRGIMGMPFPKLDKFA